MAPQSLYRRHRPQRFAELVGQEHVSTALCNAVREDRVGHAYLFSGPRGTGKTTTARLLAKSLNCLAPGDDGEPCGSCENCEAIASGTFYDLAELDAASNNGVDSIRDLIQSVGIGLGATSRRKVYIVDEVHMLSTAASNALLKTLEEPPAHVVFVLATTDPGKVLPTIRSRTQHFEFTLLTHDQLVGHMANVLEREGIEPDDEVLDVVARRAAGSARDALSLLDQALALGVDRRLDAARVRDALGDTPFERRVAILDAIAGEDPAGALLAVAATLTGGIAPRQLADDLLRTMRDAFVMDAAEGRVPYDGPAEEAERLAALAKALGRPMLTRGIDTLGSAIVDIRGAAAPDPRLVLEVAVLRLTSRGAGGGEARDDLVDRVDALERLVAELRSARVLPTRPGAEPPPSTVPATPAASGPAGPRRALGAFRSVGGRDPAAGDPAAEPPAAATLAADSTEPTAAPTPGGEAASSGTGAPAGDDDPAEPLDLDDVIEAWPVAMGALTPPLRAAVQDAQPIAVEGSVVVFGVPPRRLDAIRSRFQAEAGTIRGALATRLGRTLQFKLRAHDFDSPDALRPESRGIGDTPRASHRSSSGTETASSQPEETSATGFDEEHYDPSELTDAPDDALTFEPTAALQERLGAQIVEERPRS